MLRTLRFCRILTEQGGANQPNLQADFDGAPIGHIYLTKDGVWSASYSEGADTWTGMRVRVSNPTVKERQVGTATDVSVRVEFEHDNGLKSGAATPTAWLHEKRGYVDLRAGETKEAIIVVRNSFEWCTVTNVRDSSGYPADKTAMNFQSAPWFSGKLRITLIADGRIVKERTYSWQVEVTQGTPLKAGFPKIRPLDEGNIEIIKQQNTA